MSESLVSLPPATRRLIDGAAQSAMSCLADNFYAALLVGAALHAERAQRAQRPELVVIARQLRAPDIHALALSLRPALNKNLQLRALTTTELQHGADVFALEIAEWQSRHILLAGADALAAIEVQPVHLRHALEYKLRGLSRRVRNRVLSFVACGRPRQAEQAIVEVLDALCVAGFHLLGLLGEKAPREDGEIVKSLSRKLDVDGDAIVGLLRELQTKGRCHQPVDCLDAISAFVDRMVEVVDGLVPGAKA